MSVKEFIGECRRVLQVTRKPDKEEYKTIMKVSALGIAVIGLIGFIIIIIWQLIRGA
jgi:protein transport protein SEC61 subunit gamma and related proteins